jgi:prophage DNA circulation protein
MTPTQSFINTLSQTPTLSSTLQTNLRRLQGNLQQIINVLTYPKTVADDLTNLNTLLSGTIDVLTVVSIVPEIGEAASALKSTLQAMQVEVTPAKNAAVALESRVKPVRDAISKLSPVLDNAIRVAGNINSTSTSFLSSFTTIVACVQGLPAGAPKDESEKALNDFSTQAQPTVAALNSALSTSNDAIQSFYSALQQIVSALNFLNTISSAVEQVLGLLQPVKDLIDQLENALQSIKITIPIPLYPITVTLYEVFENFSAFINLAMAPIQSLVDDILSALHIQLPTIPGLSDLINLNITLPSIPDFTGLIQAISDALAKLQAELNLFHLDCPPKSN